MERPERVTWRVAAGTIVVAAGTRLRAVRTTVAAATTIVAMTAAIVLGATRVVAAARCYFELAAVTGSLLMRTSSKSPAGVTLVAYVTRWPHPSTEKTLPVPPLFLRDSMDLSQGMSCAALVASAAARLPTRGAKVPPGGTPPTLPSLALHVAHAGRHRVDTESATPKPVVMLDAKSRRHF